MRDFVANARFMEAPMMQPGGTCHMIRQSLATATAGHDAAWFMTEEPLLPLPPHAHLHYVGWVGDVVRNPRIHDPTHAVDAAELSLSDSHRIEFVRRGEWLEVPFENVALYNCAAPYFQLQIQYSLTGSAVTFQAERWVLGPELRRTAVETVHSHVHASNAPGNTTQLHMLYTAGELQSHVANVPGAATKSAAGHSGSSSSSNE